MPSATGWSFVSLYPWLYLKGISTGDFGQALQALLGPEARGLSATTITRLKAVWEQEYGASAINCCYPTIISF